MVGCDTVVVLGILYFMVGCETVWLYWGLYTVDPLMNELMEGVGGIMLIVQFF